MVNSMNDLNHESKTKDKYNSHLTITQRKRKNVKKYGRLARLGGVYNQRKTSFFISELCHSFYELVSCYLHNWTTQRGLRLVKQKRNEGKTLTKAGEGTTVTTNIFLDLLKSVLVSTINKTLFLAFFVSTYYRALS